MQTLYLISSKRHKLIYTIITITSIVSNDAIRIRQSCINLLKFATINFKQVHSVKKFTSKHKQRDSKYTLNLWLSTVCPVLSTPLTQYKYDQVRRVIPRRSHELTANHLHSYAKNTRLTKRQLPRNLTSTGTSPCILQLTILEKILHFLQRHCQYASIFHNLKCT